MDKSVRDFHLHTITPVPITPPEQRAGLEDRFFFAGSCFSNYISLFLQQHFFHCRTSPFGNTYNPLSIARTLARLLDNKMVKDGEVFEYKGLYRHFEFHTGVSRPDKAELLSSLNNHIRDASLFLHNTTVLVITLGTAYAYVHHKTDQVVNNCHTLPTCEFERKLLSVDEITDALTPVLQRCREICKRLLVIFTLSPVRHLRDRPEENTLSKSILCCALHHFLKLPKTYYFPAYEIVLDELRDYRYYAHDLCHPNEIAVRYIMRRFCEQCLDTDAGEYLEKIRLLKQACMHRPLHPDTEAHRKFLEIQEEKLSRIKKEYPGMPLPGTLAALQQYNNNL
jgi:hypothetical protein